MNSMSVKNKLQIGLLMAAALGASQSALATEQENLCKANVQNQISWNPGSVDAGAKEWKNENLEALCKGTKNPKEPGQCFQKVMSGNVRWGESDKWEWKNAVSLCAGADNADERITCFKGRIDAGEKWDAAIFQCQANNSISNKVN